MGVSTNSSSLAAFAAAFFDDDFGLEGVFFLEDSEVGVFGAFNLIRWVVFGVFAG